MDSRLPDPNGEVVVPTARALYHFWLYCPELRRLMLPSLDLSCVATEDVPVLPLAGDSTRTHALLELRVLAGKHGDDARLCALPDDEAKRLASCVHLLFPSPALDDGHQQPPGEHGDLGVPVAWRKIGYLLFR